MTKNCLPLIFPKNYFSIPLFKTMYKVIAFFLLSLVNVFAYELFNPMSPEGDNPAGLIIVAGENLPRSEYSLFAKELQKTSGHPLWVLAVDPKQDLSYAHHMLRNAGLQPGAPTFILGHSFKGSYSAQEHAFGHPEMYKGLIVVGSSLQSRYRPFSGLFPMMTLNGDLDGLFKPMRSAEAYYHNIKVFDSSEDAILNRPVVLLKDHNHQSLLQGKAIPNYIRKWDLRSSLSKSEAQNQMAQLVSAFMSVHSESKDSSNDKELIKAAVFASSQILEPLLKLLELEANSRLREPCNSDTPSPHCPFYPLFPMDWNRVPSNDTSCQCGTPWITEANNRLAKTIDPKLNIVTTDSIRPLEMMTPIHHPHIWNSCTDDPSSECTINVTTVSMPSFDNFDENFDYRGRYITASEIGSKMKSRQSFLEVTRDPEAGQLDLSLTEAGASCQSMNQYALEVALKHVPQDRVDLFHKYGTRVVFEKDRIWQSMEPLYAMSPLKFEEVRWQGNYVLMVGSPAFLSSVNMQWRNITLMAGLHYCKLASPARFAEWIMIDGLRHYLNGF